MLEWWPVRHALPPEIPRRTLDRHPPVQATRSGSLDPRRTRRLRRRLPVPARAVRWRYLHLPGSGSASALREWTFPTRTTPPIPGPAWRAWPQRSGPQGERREKPPERARQSAKRCPGATFGAGFPSAPNGLPPNAGPPPLAHRRPRGPTPTRGLIPPESRRKPHSPTCRKTRRRPWPRSPQPGPVGRTPARRAASSAWPAHLDRPADHRAALPRIWVVRAPPRPERQGYAAIVAENPARWTRWKRYPWRQRTQRPAPAFDARFLSSPPTRHLVAGRLATGSPPDSSSTVRLLAAPESDRRFVPGSPPHSESMRALPPKTQRPPGDPASPARRESGRWLRQSLPKRSGRADLRSRRPDRIESGARPVGDPP